MKRIQVGDTHADPADASHFDGPVQRRDLIAVDAPPSSALVVEFAPGGRTHWHSHPAGQYIYVLAGEGRIQSRGGEVEELRAGDVIYAEPDEEHWHGAGTDTEVRHLAFSFGVTRWVGSVDS